MDDVLKLFGVMVAIMSAAGVAYTMVALANVMIKRLEGQKPAPSEQLEAELADLRARLDEAEAARGRITELEERLDFAERLLAQQREHSRLPGGGET